MRKKHIYKFFYICTINYFESYLITNCNKFPCIQKQTTENWTFYVIVHQTANYISPVIQKTFKEISVFFFEVVYYYKVVK